MQGWQSIVSYVILKSDRQSFVLILINYNFTWILHFTNNEPQTNFKESKDTQVQNDKVREKAYQLAREYLQVVEKTTGCLTKSLSPFETFIIEQFFKVGLDNKYDLRSPYKSISDIHIICPLPHTPYSASQVRRLNVL